MERGGFSRIVKEYIFGNFDLTVVDIMQIEVKSDKIVDFKVTVNFHDREKLFNSDL